MNKEQRVSQEPEYTLGGFVRDVVASPDEWEEWQRVKDAPKPANWTRPAPPTSDRMYLSGTEDPSPEYVRRGELYEALVIRLRETLGDGRWQVSGRLLPPGPRQDLEPVDWASAVVDFDANTLGSFHHVRVRQVRAETNREVLMRFIERLCSAAGQPGKALTIPVIRDITNRMYPEHFTAADFAVAWKEANIPDEWHEPGRRGGKSESD